MRKRIRLILVLLSACNSIFIVAQAVTVNTTIDSAQIWIGQQTKLSFEMTQQPKQFVQSPVFSDVIVDGIELVERVKADTTQSPDGQLIIKQSYVVTAFEDSLFLIPSFPFISGQDTIWSNPVSLKVIQPFVIDTTKAQIADIKDVFQPKFNLLYFLKKLWPWFLGALFLGIILFIVMRYLRKKPGMASLTPEMQLPPFEIAVIKLEKIKKEKLWQQNRHKEYHSELTDVLREYIEANFMVPAMEMTSDEILTQLNSLRIEDKESYLALQQILHLADLVKFAKWNAGPDEHELSLTNAFYFVNQTKTEEEKKEDDIS